jgi:hypothetical protein
VKRHHPGMRGSRHDFHATRSSGCCSVI